MAFSLAGCGSWESGNTAMPLVPLSLENVTETKPVTEGVFSFLEENDLSGKKVVLFCSHGTGGLASSVKDITAVLPDSIAGQWIKDGQGRL